MSASVERRRTHARVAWVLACDMAATWRGGDMRRVVQGPGRRGRGSDNLTAECRRIACYLASMTANASPDHLAEAAGLHRVTVHKHIAWVEDRRDDPVFDRRLDELEMELVLAAAKLVSGRLDLAGGELEAAG